MSAAVRAAFEDRGLSFQQDAACQLAEALAKETGCKMGQLVRQYEAWAANRCRANSCIATVRTCFPSVSKSC